MTQTASESGLRSFQYVRPDVLTKPKMHFNMARSEVLGFNIQVLKDGGETNLHAHAASDAVWFVLGGRVRFYDSHDHAFGEFGLHEGVAIPRAAPYWFESASDEPLEIIRASATKLANNRRLDFTPPVERQVNAGKVGPELLDFSKHYAKPMEAVRYEPPERGDVPKRGVNLWRSDIMGLGVQKAWEGGETNLHAHTGADSTWFVLAGKARFYGSDPTDPVELGVHEGVFIPMATPYWFESASDVPLEMMHQTVRDPEVKNERVNYEPLKDWHVERGLGGRDASLEERG